MAPLFFFLHMCVLIISCFVNSVNSCLNILKCADIHQLLNLQTDQIGLLFYHVEMRYVITFMYIFVLFMGLLCMM